VGDVAEETTMIGMVREVALAAFAVVGLAAPPSVASVGALAVTAALVIGVLLIALRVPPVDENGACPRRTASAAISPSAPLAQSDPDAPGHPRSRAPGLVTPAT
tara:strand:- start:220 stop:531 length:312 start_codon:yes stop_codon:yes gene_type:complete